jgi:hypothetical protein
LKEFARKNKLFLQFIAVVAAFFGFDGWKTLKAIGSVLASHFDISNTLLSLSWWTSDVVGIPGARFFLVIVVIGIVFNAAFTIRTRNRPLSILSTHLTLQFRNGGAEAIATRRQVLHANRPGIAAYFLKITHDAPNGALKLDAAAKEELEVWLEHPRNLSVNPRITKIGKLREIDMVYSSALPYSWILTLLPNWVLEWGPQRLPGWIDKYLVVQHVRYVSVREYDGDYAKFTASSPRYSHHRISIVLDFSQDLGPRPHNASEITVFRRLQNAVSEEAAIQTGTPNVYQITLAPGLTKEESLVVTWKRH